MSGTNQKKNSEIGYFQFNTFPGLTLCPFLVPFEHMYAFNLLGSVHHKLKVIIKIHLMLGHPYIHSTTVLCDICDHVCMKLLFSSTGTLYMCIRIYGTLYAFIL